MTFRRSRVIRLEDWDERQHAELLVVRAEARAEKIVSKAYQAGEQRRKEETQRGAADAQAEAGALLLSAMAQRDATIHRSQSNTLRILGDALQRVLGQRELDLPDEARTRRFLKGLRLADATTLRGPLPENDEVDVPFWLTLEPDPKADGWSVEVGGLELPLGKGFDPRALEDVAEPFVTGLPRLADVVRTARPVRLRGSVHELTGLVIHASVTGVRIGELCEVSDPDSGRVIPCEVVGFRGNLVMLMPLGEATGVGPDSEVVPTGRPIEVRAGWSLLGRVLDGLGRPMDGGPPLAEVDDLVPWSVERSAPDPLTRKRVTKPISMGVKALDGLLTVGEGQRIGIFAGSGVGKSTLMGQIARNTAAEVVVVCLIGERGREVRDFIEESLGEEGMKKSVVICATSDQPSLVRLKSAFVATAVAEWFRDQGVKVLFMMDSATRFARAQREVGLALGEPPARQGYPPSVFAQIPRLMERTGNSDRGSITALYTVLVQAGDMEEPIADEVRGILDGHIILDRALGARNHWPAVDILPSLSRVMNDVVDGDHKAAAGFLRETLATYEKQRDLILLGAYEYGTDEATDYAIDRIEELEAFLRQRTDEVQALQDTRDELVALFGDKL
jgi:ATP synthase in type III secretion protein N